VTLQLGNSEQIEALARAAELDLGVVGDSGTRSAAGQEARVEDELVLIVGPTHAWARRREIGSAELAGQPLLLRELPHTEAIKQGVLAGLGVAFVSVYAIRGEQATGRLRSLRVRGLRIVRHFHLIHDERRRLSTAARTLAELFPAAAPARVSRRAGSRTQAG
jgi:DNA-binding transcriptional LysR family regulator